MRIEFIKDYSAKTSSGEVRTISAGTVLELSPQKGELLKAAVVVVDLDYVVGVWRRFVLAADAVYRKSPKKNEAFRLHKIRIKSATVFFKAARMEEAESELKKALVLLA